MNGKGSSEKLVAARGENKRLRRQTTVMKGFARVLLILSYKTPFAGAENAMNQHLLCT